MGRPNRIRLAGLPFHVVQRGHNRSATFCDKQDYLDYLGLLRTAARRSQTSIHAFVLMTNHVHLLLTSRLPDGVSRLLQYVAGRYSAHFNKRYVRTGSLWESRFRASPVDADRYLLACYRYIELNPVRAGIVRSPDAYPWSSYRVNSTGAPSSLITPHPTYLSLGRTPLERAVQYRELFREGLPDDTVDRIRQGLNDGVPTGDDAFRQNLEVTVQCPLVKRKRGRPPRREIVSDTFFGKKCV